jgi:hypothetical protein
VWLEVQRTSIDSLVERGFPQEQAEAYALLMPQTSTIGASMRTGNRSCASCVYALSAVCFEARKRQSGNVDVPRLYWHLTGRHSLSEADPAWHTLLEHDSAGFRGLVSLAPVCGFREPQCFTEAGFKCRVVDATAGARMELRDSDVVCFESFPDDEFGCHAAVLTTSDLIGAWPPNTLFSLTEVLEPGTWEAPGGVYPMQRLCVVMGTFMPRHGRRAWRRLVVAR